MAKTTKPKRSVRKKAAAPQVKKAGSKAGSPARKKGAAQAKPRTGKKAKAKAKRTAPGKPRPKATPAKMKGKAVKKTAKASVAKAPVGKGKKAMKPASRPQKAVAPVRAKAKSTAKGKSTKAGGPPKKANTVKKAPAAAAKPASLALKKKPVVKAPAQAKATKAAPPAKKVVPAAMPPTPVAPSTIQERSVKQARKERFQMEFYLNATPASLFEFISSPSGFSEWFCDDVDVREHTYVFKWGDEQEVAECLVNKFNELVRFRWKEDALEDPNAFFELRIRVDGMTNETCLIVTDHAWPADLEEAKALWGSQLHTLARVLGA
jgi:uncharacterized protein YndB with AHSA1/START domain